MALERKDVRSKLDADMHAALTVVCETDQLDIGEWVESLIVRELHRRIHAAKNIAEKTSRLGITGSRRESAGVSGNNRETQGVAGNAAAKVGRR